jgi:hypothetical protein
MSCTLGPLFDLLDDRPHNSFTIKRDSPNATGVLTSGIPSLTRFWIFSISDFSNRLSSFPLHENVSNTIVKINFSLYVVFKCTVNVFNL